MHTTVLISTRARFALHGLCYLARLPVEETTPFPRLFSHLAAWSPRMTLSRTYVGKVFQDLSRAGLVRAVPGRRGGYRLACPPREITAFDVVRAVDRVVPEDSCLLADGRCAVQGRCGVSSVIREAVDAFYGVLATQTLEMLARRMVPPAPVRRKRAPARRRHLAP